MADGGGEPPIVPVTGNATFTVGGRISMIASASVEVTGTGLLVVPGLTVHAPATSCELPHHRLALFSCHITPPSQAISTTPEVLVSATPLIATWPPAVIVQTLPLVSMIMPAVPTTTVLS